MIELKTRIYLTEISNGGDINSYDIDSSYHQHQNYYSRMLKRLMRIENKYISSKTLLL